jgi:predicted nucleotidyltransferase
MQINAILLLKYGQQTPLQRNGYEPITKSIDSSIIYNLDESPGRRRAKMKDLEEIKQVLSRQKQALAENFKVKEIGIFGSYVRGEQEELSDVDILVEFNEPIGWEFIDLLDYLENVLNMKVDLVTPNALRPQFKERILKKVAYV